MAKQSKPDVYQTVTDRIVRALQKGTAPWVKPWGRQSSTKGATSGMPYNFATGKPYRGINIMLLWAEAQDKGYSADAWMTYKQAAAKGGQVRKGEKGTQIVFWRILKIEERNDVTGEPEDKEIPMARLYSVFNVDQIDGLPQAEPVTIDETQTDEDFDGSAIDAMIDGHDITITHGGGSAYYSPAKDAIRLPLPEAFTSRAAYYGTKLHEVVHWTGHSTRMDRDQTGQFGSPDYAAEELVAEMGSAFLCGLYDVPGKLQHEEYLGHWIKKLTEDKRAIFKASSQAQKAVDFLTVKADELEEAA